MKRCTHCGAKVRIETLTCPDCGNQRFCAERDFDAKETITVRLLN